MPRALLFGFLAGVLVFAPVIELRADDDCGRCCKLQQKKERTLRNQRAADAVCLDSGDEQSCELAQQLAEKYQQLCEEYAKSCGPQSMPLRAE